MEIINEKMNKKDFLMNAKDGKDLRNRFAKIFPNRSEEELPQLFYAFMKKLNEHARYYEKWANKGKSSIKRLYKDFKIETDDKKTTLKEFSLYMFRNCKDGQKVEQWIENNTEQMGMRKH